MENNCLPSPDDDCINIKKFVLIGLRLKLTQLKGGSAIGPLFSAGWNECLKAVNEIIDQEIQDA